MDLIINADDFGKCHAVNVAIRDAFRQGLISSTTLMANMDGFDEAVDMVRSGEVKNVGIHLNLFEGIPLTHEMSENRLYCDDHGRFRFLDGHISFFAPRKIASTIIFRELKAQIKRILATGVSPTHLDSHGHYHNNWFVGKTVIDLALEFSIPYVRTSPNLYSIRSWYKKIANSLFDRNKRLEKYGLKLCDYMGNIPEVKALLENNPSGDCIVEMMCHPVYDENNVLLDAEFRSPLSQLLSFPSWIELKPYSSFGRTD